MSLVDLFALVTGMTDRDSLSKRSASPLSAEFPLGGKRAQTENNTTSNRVSQASPKVQRGQGSPNYLMGRSKPTRYLPLRQPGQLFAEDAQVVN